MDPFREPRPTGSAGAVALAPLLAGFGMQHGMNAQQLADFMGLAPERLAALASLQAPDPTDGRFAASCAELAHATGCDCWALRTVIRHMPWPCRGDEGA